MARIYVRKNYWWGDFQIEGRPRWNKSLNIHKDDKSAEKRAEHALHLKMEEEREIESRHDMKWEAFKEFHERERAPQVDESTSGREAAAMRLLEDFAPTPILWLSEVSPELLAGFKTYLITKGGRENATINRTIRAVRKFMRWAEGLGKVNPPKWPKSWSNVKLLEEPKQKKKVFDEAQVARLLELASEKGELWWAVMMLGYEAGLRRNEIVNLKVKDVDFENRLLEVVPNQTVTRTKNEPRLIEIEPASALRLKRFCQHGKEYVVGERKFEDFYTRAISSICKRAGVDGSLHTLRHSITTHMLDNGAEITDVQKMLGHARIETTLGYRHFDKEQAARVAAFRPKLQSALKVV